MERKFPQIIHIVDYAVYAKQYIPIKNCFQAKDHEGDAVRVKVTRIIDCKEQVSFPVEYEGIDCLWFAEPGIYKVYVEAIDEENRSSFIMVKLLVNKGEDL